MSMTDEREDIEVFTTTDDENAEVCAVGVCDSRATYDCLTSCGCHCFFCTYHAQAWREVMRFGRIYVIECEFCGNPDTTIIAIEPIH